ncbi:MAG TPA: ABC transporter substrate-binding protein [Rhodospirillaceae bacterium]|nr:ABC transporter substrate-binding protein [Rhodospirillaceae bacterium]
MAVHKSFLSLFLYVLVFVALLVPSARAQDEKKIKIVASFSVLGDMIEQIGGNLIDLTVLVKAGQEAHGFQPKPQDAKKVAEAEIVAINGLKLEGWMGRLIEASGTKAKLLVASKGVKPRLLEITHEGHHHAHSSGEVLADPHAWQDLKKGQLYAKNIAVALIEARPTQKKEIKKRYHAYVSEMKKLDAKMRADFALIPQEKRKVITSHDAFGYFGAAYGVTFIAPVGISSEAEASATDIVKIIEQIKKEGVHVLFVESLVSPRLIEQIAKDTGAHVGGTLYADTLSLPDGEAPTYLDMFKHNAKKMLKAMRL